MNKLIDIIFTLILGKDVIENNLEGRQLLKSIQLSSADFLKRWYCIEYINEIRNLVKFFKFSSFILIGLFFILNSFNISFSLTYIISILTCLLCWCSLEMYLNFKKEILSVIKYLLIICLVPFIIVMCKHFFDLSSTSNIDTESTINFFLSLSNQQLTFIAGGILMYSILIILTIIALVLSVSSISLLSLMLTSIISKFLLNIEQSALKIVALLGGVLLKLFNN